MTSKRAAQIAAFIALLILIFKFWVASLTHSQAVLSDALEGIVNVVASLIAYLALEVATKPADEKHPYGHGKLEFFSGAFEGGFLTAAGVFIVLDSISVYLNPIELRSLDLGMGLVVLGGVFNLLLGLWLRYVGKRLHSDALLASATHVISDFWTSVAAVGGLALVYWTGISWFDPLIAGLLGLFLMWTGSRIIRRAAGGLLDEEDAAILRSLAEAFSTAEIPGVIGVHEVRAIRSGSYHFVDAHVVVPQMWDIAKAHDLSNKFAAEVLENYPTAGEIHFHLDPCRQAHCPNCDYLECPIRLQPFVERKPYTPELIRIGSARDGESKSGR